MISAFYYIHSLRFAVPTAVMLGVAPQFLCIWLAWRVMSLPLPHRVFQRGDELMYDFYQSLVCFFFETYSGAEVFFYGDCIPWDKPENVIFLCNHQSSVDWVVSDLMAIRQGSLGRLRYILKNGLKYLPLYGFYFAQHSCIYVKRNGAQDPDDIGRILEKMKALKIPMWLVIFPEGTRYNLENTKVIENSRNFAAEHGLPVLSHVLLPRTKATEVSFDKLCSGYVDAIYDLTIAYSVANENPYPRKTALSMPDFLASSGQQIHVYCRRHEPASIPKDSHARKQWIYQSFAEKDRILNKFYSEGGRMPGVARKKRLSWMRTLPYFIFWMGTLLPFLTTKWGRSLYWKMWLLSGVGTVSYMALLFNK